MVAALARADSTIYGDLVTNLTARSYADIDKISLAEIRSLALSAYQTGPSSAGPSRLPTRHRRLGRNWHLRDPMWRRRRSPPSKWATRIKFRPQFLSAASARTPAKWSITGTETVRETRPPHQPLPCPRRPRTSPSRSWRRTSRTPSSPSARTLRFTS